MSNESWEEVLPYSLSTHAVLESTSDDGSGQKPEPQQSEPTLIYGTNFDEDVDGTGPLMQARGALVWLVIIAVWIFAALSPLLILVLFWHGGAFAYTALAGIFAIAIYPNIAADQGKSGRWMWLRRAALWARYWHRSCGIAFEKEGPESWDTMPPTLFCYHPHGVFTQSYLVNGSLNNDMPDIFGLVACILHFSPMFQLVIGRWLNTTGPASKGNFVNLMEKGKSFAIIPGGFQEAALSKLGTDRVWIKERKGFIKYALKYGYRLRPVYTFGECDAYWNVQGSWSLRLWLTSFNIPAVLPFGFWWCPIVPRRARLMSVFGEPVVLPKLEKPSQEDVNKWHGIYIEALTGLFDRHKAKYASNPEGELEVW